MGGIQSEDIPIEETTWNLREECWKIAGNLGEEGIAGLYRNGNDAEDIKNFHRYFLVYYESFQYDLYCERLYLK